MAKANSLGLNEAKIYGPDKVWKKWVRRGVAVAGTVAVGALVVGGAHQLIGNNTNQNLTDFKKLKEFTSADHQKDRCDVQAAYDAQEKMREHFAATGGVTEQQATAMSAVVGLTPDEITRLLDTRLFQISYDCDTPVASSNVATQGLAELAVGGGIVIGAVGMAGFSALRRRQYSSVIDTIQTGEVA